jgi:type IV pilus assembly protein PilY1
MYEAALYWRDMNAHYGPLLATDPNALDSVLPMRYRRPAEYACAKNFIVYLSDGEPTQDYDTDDLVGKLPNWTQAVGRSGCTGGTGLGACLDDVAEYLSKEDINPDVPGTQTVATYTIGFAIDLPILEETARKSGGKYYQAEDVKSLTVALTDIVTNIFDRDISFTAPAVAVNAFNRTQHLNDLYVSVFRASNKVHWPGNIKKYTIADAEIVDKYTNSAVNPATGYFRDSAHNFWNGTASADGANVHVGQRDPPAHCRTLFSSSSRVTTRPPFPSSERMPASMAASSSGDSSSCSINHARTLATSCGGRVLS